MLFRSYDTDLWSKAHIPWGFPGGDSGKELTSQCRQHKRRGFNPWVGKIPWRRAWQLPPVFLPGESPWTEEPGGLQPWGCTELDMTERLSTAQHRATSVLVEMPIIRVLLATAGSAAKHVMGCQQCFLIHWRLVISTTWNTSRRQLK